MAYDHLRSVIKRLHPVDSGHSLIRVGHDGDGGYLIPDALEGIKYCFSPGVSGYTALEDQMVQRGMECFLLDGSMDCPDFKYPAGIHFQKKWLKQYDSHDSLSLATWIRESIGDYTGDLFMQMDIEGYEYETLGTMPDELLDQFRILVVEFHNLYLLQNGTWLNVFERLCNFFHVVHIHPNNFNLPDSHTHCEELVIPPVLEFTFMNKRSFSPWFDPAHVTSFPHPLDADNNPFHPHEVLHSCWYR